MTKPSDYEENARHQIWLWKNPEQSWFDKAIAVANRRLDKAGEVVLKTPRLGPALQKALVGMLGVINDVSHWLVRPDAILEEYRHFTRREVTGLSDIYTLDLQSVDRVIGWLDTKYEGIALAEGAAAGGLGVLTPAAALAAIPADVVALMTLNLRAVGEYATYCGFDVSSQEKRLFALNVLAYASSPTDGAKQLALAQLVRISRDLALRKTWKDLERNASVQAVQQIAKALSIRLTKAKLAQVLPVAGAVIGGGFNAYYTNKVCNAAFYLYRERFLAEKYGVEVIETAVEPAETLESKYEDEDDRDDGRVEQCDGKKR
jgi:EcsC protein family